MNQLNLILIIRVNNAKLLSFEKAKNAAEFITVIIKLRQINSQW